MQLFGNVTLQSLALQYLTSNSIVSSKFEAQETNYLRIGLSFFEDKLLAFYVTKGILGLFSPTNCHNSKGFFDIINDIEHSKKQHIIEVMFGQLENISNSECLSKQYHKNILILFIKFIENSDSTQIPLEKASQIAQNLIQKHSNKLSFKVEAKL